MRALGRRAGWGCVLALLWLTRPLGAQTLPPNFIEDIVASNLDFPIAFAALPGGRLLIAQKGGVVRLVKNGVLQPVPFIDVSAKVNDYWDRGLLGIAADPSFTTNNFVYLYYVFEHNASDYGGPKTARLTRVTAVRRHRKPLQRSHPARNAERTLVWRFSDRLRLHSG